MVRLTEDVNDLKTIVKTLLSARINSTLDELKKDYDQVIGSGELPHDFSDLRKLVMSIDGVKQMVNKYGLEMYMVENEKVSHIQQMVRRQRPRPVRKPTVNRGNLPGIQPQRRSLVDMAKESSSKSSLQEQRPQNGTALKLAPPLISHYDRGNKRSNSFSSRNSVTSSHTDGSYRRLNARRSTGPPNKIPRYNSNSNERNGPSHRNEKPQGYYYNLQFIGDDFLMSCAKIELGQKFERDPKTGVLSIGACTSGITIKDAARKVRSNIYIHPRVIVYLGSVDILHGRDLSCIKFDYCDLMSAFCERGIKPIVCTLAPLANQNNNLPSIQVLNEFNKFLLEQNHWDVLNINECFVHETTGRTIYEIYLPQPRKVSGSSRPHVLWNKLGRQSVLKKIKSHIGRKS